jgi:hypothetical protein
MLVVSGDAMVGRQALDLGMPAGARLREKLSSAL